MAQIIWSSRARRQFEMTLSVIGRESGQAIAEKWGRRFAKALRQIEQFPEIGSPVEDVNVPGLREQIVGPYRVIDLFDGTDCHLAFVIRAQRQLDEGLTPDDILS